MDGEDGRWWIVIVVDAVVVVLVVVVITRNGGTFDGGDGHGHQCTVLFLDNNSDDCGDE